jgi:hypothetical protein
MPEAAVILWWGPDIRILCGGGRVRRHTLPSGDEDPAPAILGMIAEERGSCRSVRIIHQPDTLDIHETACPGAARARLRRTLAAEFPALDRTDAIWSVEPGRRGSAGAGAIVSIDSGGRLRPLAEGLAAAGLAVEGAWPLHSVIEAVPACATSRRGFLCIAATGRRAVVACAGETGDRTVRLFSGDGFAEDALAGARSARARFEDGDEPPGLIAAEDAALNARLRDAVQAHALVDLSLESLMGHARRLSPGGASDFLAPRSRLAHPRALRRAAAAAGIVLLAGSACLSLEARRQKERDLRENAASREQRARLEQAIAGRTALRERMDRAARLLTEAQAPLQLHHEFLAALGKAIPDAIVLRSIGFQKDRFIIRGRVLDGAGRGDGPLAAFCRELAPQGSAWRLEAPESAAGGAEFTLKGSLP